MKLHTQSIVYASKQMVFLFSAKHEESLMGQSHDFVHPSSCGCLTPEALPVLACCAG